MLHALFLSVEFRHQFNPCDNTEWKYEVNQFESIVISGATVLMA
jgi:hypothetical protein